MKKALNSGTLTGSEKKYRALFDNAPIGISVVDVNRKILEANKALEKVIDLSSEELTKELYKNRRYVRSDGSELPEDELPSTLSINKGTPVLDVEIGIEAGQKIIAWTQVSAAPVDLPEKCAVVITQDITERKKLESRLIASEKKYRTFFDNSLDAILITSPNGAIHSANKAACKMLGREEQEICQIGRNGIVEQTPELIEALGKRRATGTFYGELSFLRKNGTRFPVEITSSVFVDSEGKELTTIIARDITERKKTEKALQESENRYRTLFENSLMGISVASPDGRLLHANKACARMYGYESPESMTERVTNVGSLCADKDGREKILQKMSINGVMEPREVEVIRRDGSHFFVLLSASEIRDFAGNLLFNMATHLDLTERKKNEEKVRAAALYSRNLIESSLDPLVTINAEGKITDVNLATEHVTGFKRDRLIGSEFADYFVESEKAREAYNIVFSKGVIKNYPLTILHKNGRTTDVLYNATLYKNEEGVVQGVFAAARDITLRKRMENKLKNSKKLLEKLNQHLNEVRENERSEIALNLHDDLGQRLTALCLDIAWVKSRIGVQTNPVRKKLEEMIREINETIDGIKEISSFLRPTILYDLGLVPAIISQLSKFENQSGIKSYFYFDSEEFNVDEKISLIFYRIIQESLTNIVRHSGASAIELSLKKLKNAIELVIKDDGVGIENEKVNSLTSMGLVGIRERVKSCHGEVSIKGDKGSGTTIIVTIPIKKRGL